MGDIKRELFRDIEKEILKDKQNKSRKSFNLLYVLSNNTFRADEFHEKCDGKGPTLTLLYGKFNNLFGGYTSRDWSCESHRTKRDESAFLFFKNKNAEAECKFFRIPWQSADNAIVCDKKFGPTFGYTKKAMFRYYDLQTCYETGKPMSQEDGNGWFTLNGQLHVPYLYKPKSDSERTSPGGKTTGDINGGTLSVSAMEVYQVIDDRLKVPWRKACQDEDIKKMKNKLENIEPLARIGLQHYNILLLGVIGAGKSSFYNTVATVFENKMKDIAPTAEEQSSVTNEVHAYDILNENGDKINIKLLDIRGYEEERSYEHELDFILEGKIADGYQFPDKTPARGDIRIQNNNPTINDQVHLVCLIVDTTKFKIQSDKMVEQIDTIKKLIRRRGLPLVAVATKFDHLCPKIAEDAGHIYWSPKAKYEISALSDTFGIQLRHIFPIVNYINDREEITPGKNKLVIEALHSMMQITRDLLFHHRGALRDEDNSWTMRVKRLQICSLKEDRENEMKDHCQEMFEDNTLRVLCYGPVNSGKSSFIDSIMSLLTGKIVSKATGGYIKANKNGTSKTEKFQMFQLKFTSEPGKTKTSNVFLCDMPGIQDKEGVKLEQTKLIVNGNVPNRFKIQNKKIDKYSKHFVKDTGSMCKIHCVCFLFDISDMETLTETVKDTCKRFQEWLSDKGIPCVVVVTKGDQTSAAVRDNALQMYENKLIRENKDKLIEYFSFKESKIFPVRNYIHENQTVPEIDALLLDALKEIVSIGYEYLGDNSGDESGVSDSSTDEESSSDQE